MHGDLYTVYKPLRTVLIVASLLGASCAPMTIEDKERREYNDAIAAENWRLCQQVYTQHRKPTYHRGHVHNGTGRVYGTSKIEAIRSDLMDNNCRQVLGDHWAHEM